MQAIPTVLGVLVIGWLWAQPQESTESTVIRLQAGQLGVTLDKTGHIVSLTDLSQGRELMPPGQRCTLLALELQGQRQESTRAEWDGPAGRLRLLFGESISALVVVRCKRTHLTFTLETVRGADPTRIFWGPFNTIVGKIVGETVCVVRDDDYAFGLQSLTIQNDCGGSAAEFGSRLHATAAAGQGGIEGSAIALFGCRAAEALDTLGQIEVAEGLPHPMFDGVWSKVSPEATAPYLISEFSEADLDAHLDLTERLGFRYLYSMNALETWGHFILNRRRFPDGPASMKRCVERAAARGIGLGVHTLSAFITTNDPYVTPRPDPRLARLGSSTLVVAIDDKATEIVVADREPFTKGQIWGWSRRFALLEEEIIEYAAVSDTDPPTLTGCVRGCFGTRAAAHEPGTDIGRLATHNYATFYPGIENGMADEMADNLSRLFRETGLSQTSFDGLEGLMDYGWPGDYTRNRFVKRVLDAWPQHRISDASNLLHYTWHIHPRMNWGEPWGKAMREGQLEGRLNNQAYFDRNLYPHMMGWFEFRAASPELEATSLDEVEWMLSKCAAFDAGFALVSSPDIFHLNGHGEAAARAIREWEKARRAHAFSPSQRERLKVPLSDWHLEPVGERAWELTPLWFSPPLMFAGLPGGQEATWQVSNPFASQPLRLVLRVLPGGAVSDPAFAIGDQQLVFPVQVSPGQYLVFEGDGEASLCDANWNVLHTVAGEGAVPQLSAGEQTMRFSCKADGEPGPQVQIRIKAVGPAESVTPSS